MYQGRAVVTTEFFIVRKVFPEVREIKINRMAKGLKKQMHKQGEPLQWPDKERRWFTSRAKGCIFSRGDRDCNRHKLTNKESPCSGRIKERRRLINHEKGCIVFLR